MPEGMRESLAVAPGKVGESLMSLRLCSPAAQQQMQLSLSKLGQLTAVQVFRANSELQIIDGFKRVRAARELCWPTVRVEVQPLDSAGAKIRLWQCNVGTGLSDLEQAWLVRSLYREDGLTQPQIALLLQRHKSWVCRRLAMAEELSEELSAGVRLGLVCARAAVELARLPRGNQDEVGQVVMRRGLTTRQTTRLVDTLLAAPREQWSKLLKEATVPLAALPKGGMPRRTPAEQLMADAWTIKRLAVRMQAMLLSRSLASLGESQSLTVADELHSLLATLRALLATLEGRLDGGPGVVDAA